MPSGIRNLFWENEKHVELFKKLCKKSESRPLIRWKKFRKLDKKGVFKDVSNSQLTSTHRKMWLVEKGICPKCGKYYLEDNQKVCSECVERNKKNVVEFYKRKRETNAD